MPRKFEETTKTIADVFLHTYKDLTNQAFQYYTGAKLEALTLKQIRDMLAHEYVGYRYTIKLFTVRQNGYIFQVSALVTVMNHSEVETKEI